jgi:membrane protease subunit HflK
MLTGDLNIVDVTWTIQFRITDPKAWLFNVENSRVYNSVTRESVDNRIQTIRDISQSSINMLVGDRAYFDVIGAERTNIETQALDLIDSTLNTFGLGVDIVNVKLQNIVPPKGEVQAAFEDVNMAYQDMERMINEGKESYNKEIPKAKGVAKQMLEEAEGYRIARINNAEGDVALFEAINKEYQKSRQVTRQRLYYEMIEEVFSDTGKTDIVDKNLDNFLPLKNVGPTEGRGTR